MSEKRIQKIISESGICARRKAEELIKAGKVSVNGEIATIGEKADISKDKILINGTPLPKKVPNKVILLNKPKGIITSCFDPEGRRTVISLIPHHIRKGMHPVGRLDIKSRGAILITNDGSLTLKLTHPRYNHPKTYSVWVKGLPTGKVISEWQKGVEIDGSFTKRLKVKIMKHEGSKTLLKVIMTEGRNRQIRRTSEALGHPVIDLKRTSIGCIKLDGLKEGNWRDLSEGELSYLYK